MLQRPRRISIDGAPECQHTVAGPPVRVHFWLMNAHAHIEREANPLLAEAFQPCRYLGGIFDGDAPDHDPRHAHRTQPLDHGVTSHATADLEVHAGMPDEGLYDRHVDGHTVP